jgi:NADPH2:quinone reductase
VTNLSVDDRIVSHAGLTPDLSENGLQEYALADIDALMKIPEGVTDDQAATLPVNLIACVVGLFGALRIPAPWSAEGRSFNYKEVMVLIIGGGSSCGKFAVQLAKRAGFGEVVVVGGDEGELEEMGATHVVDRYGGHDVVLERVREIVGDELVCVLDAINPPWEGTTPTACRSELTMAVKGGIKCTAAIRSYSVQPCHFPLTSCRTAAPSFSRAAHYSN